MAKTLLVEDDLSLANMLFNTLSHEGYIVEVTDNAADASFRLQAYYYDAVILDLSLPDKSGLEVLKDFRSQGGITPIIILTGKDSINDKKTGLDAGADDYLTKPFHYAELTARLRALCRRFKNIKPNVVKIGELELDRAKRVLSKNGEEIHLTPKDYALMEFLMLHPGEAFSSDVLFGRVWEAESAATDEAIRSALKRIRKAIGDTECNIIQNVRKYGYMLKGE